MLKSASRELRTGLGKDPDVATHDDRFTLLVDDHQSSCGPHSDQVRGTAQEQRLVLGRCVREPYDEGGQVRRALFDPVSGKERLVLSGIGRMCVPRIT